jgi:hypothetical protein
MNSHLPALFKCVAELHEAGLKACHCIEEFHLQRIRPLGRREKLTFKCPQLTDPSCEPTDGNIHFLLNC